MEIQHAREPVVSAALVLSMSGGPWQEYVEFKSQQIVYGRFPAQPKVIENTFTSQFESVCRACLQRRRKRGPLFRDGRGLQQYPAIATEKAKKCPPGAEACSGTATDASSTGAGYWKADIAGAVMNATWMLQQRDAKVTYVGWANMDLVEGNMVSLINNTDKSRTSAAVYMHENKLYILEGTAPAGYPVPDWFQQSVGWIDENGNGIRYLTIYHNGLPKPEIARRGGQGQGQGRGQGQGGQPAR